MSFESDRILADEFLAPDAANASNGPWYMYRSFEQTSAFQAFPVHIKELARKFMRDGFLIFEQEISESDCEEAIRAFQHFTKINADYFDPFRDGDGFLERLVNLHLVVPELARLFSKSVQVLEFQDWAFGRETSVYTSLYFEKGSSQDIHRDSPYFCTRPEFLYFGTWFALEAATEDNGCLKAIPGGHLVKEIDRAKLASRLYGEPKNVPAVPQNLFDEYQHCVEEECQNAGLRQISLPLKKGSVLVWHPQLPHGGSIIKKPELSRHSIVMHTAPVGTPVYKANAFFNPDRVLAEIAQWQYSSIGGRLCAQHDSIDIMHRAPRAVTDFS